MCIHVKCDVIVYVLVMGQSCAVLSHLISSISVSLGQENFVFHLFFTQRRNLVYINP